MVSIAAGRLSGVSTGAVIAFLGIPYAAPPVGPNRWRPPRPAAPWRGLRAAKHFSASCYQPYPPPLFGPYTQEFVRIPAPDEDCLYLNVWTPAARRTSLPVLVWIHGGGFLGGSAAIPIYDGARLASRGAVVVSINYRVGPFGFLAHPDLSRESPMHVSGNYGLQDQIEALRWVRRNIERFGGDPLDVTIAGQSAGAASVNDLMVAPAAAGLFQRAIAESGSGMGVDAADLHRAESDGAAFADYLGAKDVAALRALPAARIQAAVWLPIGPGGGAGPPPIRFRPVRDGQVLPVDPADPAGSVRSLVPLLTGFTADENFAVGVRSAEDFESDVDSQFGSQAAEILEHYPHASDAEASTAARLLSRDRFMTSLIMWTRGRIRHSGQVVFAYVFDHAAPTTRPSDFGAFHTAEVPYVFGVLDTRARPYQDEDRKLSALMQNYWLNFMRSGNPNGPGLPAWSPSSAESASVMALGLEPGMREAVSSPARFAALQAFVEQGGTLKLL